MLIQSLYVCCKCFQEGTNLKLQWQIREEKGLATSSSNSRSAASDAEQNGSNSKTPKSLSIDNSHQTVSEWVALAVVLNRSMFVIFIIVAFIVHFVLLKEAFV